MIEKLLGSETFLWASRFSEQDPQAYSSIISAAEQKLVQQKATQQLQQHCLLSFGLRRAVLSRYVNIAPQQLTFTVTAKKKPILSDNQIYFNVSHSGDYWVIVVNAKHPVGIDIEETTRDVECLTLAERFFAPAETELLRRSDNPEELFWRFWTAKEALLKATGEGIVYGLEKIQLMPVDEKTLQIISPAELAERFGLMQLKIYENTLLTVAVSNSV